MTKLGSCSACTFFDAQRAEAPGADAGGLCRFNPPVSQPSPEAHGLWPVVSKADWCGHFAKDAAPVAAAE